MNEIHGRWVCQGLPRWFLLANRWTYVASYLFIRGYRSSKRSFRSFKDVFFQTKRSRRCKNENGSNHYNAPNVHPVGKSWSDKTPFMRILGIVSYQHLPTNHWLILKSKDDTFCFPWSLHHFHNAAAFLVEVELGSPWEKPIRFDCSIRSDTCNQPNAWEKSEGRFKSESRFKCPSTVTPPP